MARFKSSLPSNGIGTPKGPIYFDNHFYTTDNPVEVAILEAWGTQRGITITRVDLNDADQAPTPLTLPPAPEGSDAGKEAAAIGGYDLETVLALIGDCKGEGELKELVETLSADFPEEIVPEADREIIKDAIQKRFAEVAGFRPNAQETVASIKACETIEAVDAIAKDDERVTVQRAAEARKKELAEG